MGFVSTPLRETQDILESAVEVMHGGSVHVPAEVAILADPV